VGDVAWDVQQGVAHATPHITCTPLGKVSVEYRRVEESKVGNKGRVRGRDKERRAILNFKILGYNL
jgi:hypothetical protein